MSAKIAVGPPPGFEDFLPRDMLFDDTARTTPSPMTVATNYLETVGKFHVPATSDAESITWYRVKDIADAVHDHIRSIVYLDEAQFRKCAVAMLTGIALAATVNCDKPYEQPGTYPIYANAATLADKMYEAMTTKNYRPVYSTERYLKNAFHSFYVADWLEEQIPICNWAVNCRKQNTCRYRHPHDVFCLCPHESGITAFVPQNHYKHCRFLHSDGRITLCKNGANCLDLKEKKCGYLHSNYATGTVYICVANCFSELDDAWDGEPTDEYGATDTATPHIGECNRWHGVVACPRAILRPTKCGE